MTGGRSVFQRRIGFFIGLLLALPLLLPMTVHGLEVNLQRVAAGDEEIYRYVFPGGVGFETTIPMGSDDQMITIFSFDDGVGYELYRDGEQVPYAQDDLLMQDGEYLLRVSYLEMTAEFPFTLSGSAADYQMNFGEIVPLERLEGGYSQQRQRFVYTFPNGASVTVNVPNGNIGASHVTFAFTGAVTGNLVRDDEAVSFAAGETISEEGVYHLSLTAMPELTAGESGSMDDIQTTDTNIYRADFYFRILKSPCRDMGVFNPPQDFIISSVSLDGRAVDFSPNACFLKDDGNYSFQLRHVSDSAVTGSSNIQIDREAPLLSFPQGGADGAAEGTVLLLKSEEDAVVTILRDGEAYAGDPTRLTGAGYYRITIRDAAGNQREYRIRLSESFRFPWTTVLIVLSAVLVGIIAAAVFGRRNMRVI